MAIWWRNAPMTTQSLAYTPGPQGEFAHRPIVWGTRGMVGGGSQLTAQAGMRILWQGGNAVDAAVAAAFAAGVLEPTAHYSLGGEVAFLFYDRSSQQVRSVVGQGWAPRAATVDHYLATWGEIPSGVLSTTVPGVISALLAVLSHYGTMSFRQVVESALGFARDGFPTYQLFTNRTWSQGITLLQALNILEGYDLAALGHNSPQAIHLQVEALKLAFADREMYVGDLAHVEVPVAGLLSKEYAALRRGLIDLNQAQAVYPPGDPRKMLAVAPDYRPQPAAPTLEPVGGDADGTTYLATVDAQGNMVSATPSSFAGLAQGMILGDTGILINCRGCYFWLDPDNPNALAPHKRPRTTPCTFIVLKQGHPCMTLGTPGGDSQPQSCLQVFTNMVDFGLNVQEAVEAPRFCGSSFPQSPWPHRTYPNRLEVEGRLSQAVVEALSARGHRVEVVGPWGVRNGFAPILVNPETGIYHGGADPRKESVM